jgi:proteasome accessory factor B
MSARRTERLLNLVICLLHTRRYLSAQQIRETVAGYGGLSDEAFKRKFERDKEDLRELGIPLETGTDGTFEDEVGYRISRDDYALPEIQLEPDEMAVLGVAARTWQRANLGVAASGALLKLQAAGLQTDDAAPVALESRVTTSEPAFEPLRLAASARRRVRFDYREAGAARRLEPWGLVSWHGRWYVVGHDLDKSATRVFRLSRVVGKVTAEGPAAAFDIPPGTDLRSIVVTTVAEPAAATARLRVRSDAAFTLRRRATRVTPESAAGSPTGWDLVELGYSDAERLADDVVGFGCDVVVLGPAEARDAVVARLQGALA